MKNPFGFMQGRLLPKYKGRYQAHPFNYWQKEFFIGSKLGFDCIEYIFDYENADLNPIITDIGKKEIIHLMKKNNIKIYSICADYFMKAPIHSSNAKVASLSELYMQKLIESSNELGIKYIILPCVDESSILNDEQKKILLVKRLKKILGYAEKKSIFVVLETDLPPLSFVNFIKSFDSPMVKINYDTGNSASLGYDPQEEIDTYGKFINVLHIKDRNIGGGPVFLGKGNTKFDVIFKNLKIINFNGPIIMQCLRDEEGIQILLKQKDWLFNSTSIKEIIY